MGTRATRTFKIDWVMARVKAASISNQIISEEKLIGEFIVFFGSSRITAREILKSLEYSGKIVREYGEIWTPESLEMRKALESNNSIHKELNSGGK